MSEAKIPTASDVLKRQREEHGVIVPANKAGLPAVNGGGASAYLAEHGVGMSGTFIKFSKDGKFVKTFRSSFRDWAAETTAYPNHVVEMALAHAVGNGVEAAYRRGDLFEKRRRLMQDWSDYCSRPHGDVAGHVVPLRA